MGEQRGGGGGRGGMEWGMAVWAVGRGWLIMPIGLTLFTNDHVFRITYFCAADTFNV